MKIELVQYGRTVSLEESDENIGLPDVVNMFERILKRAGYVFGKLEVKDEADSKG